MSEAAKAARAANKAKANRLAAGDPKAKVDASSWTPPEMMNTEKKTGLRPVSRRAYKRGGKVHGEEAPQNAGRKARKSSDMPTATAIANAKVNRNVKNANAEEFGQPHIGGYANGGYAKGGKTDDEHFYANHKWDEDREKWIPKKKPKPIRSEDEVGDVGPSPMDNPDTFRPGSMKKGGRAKKMDGGAMGDPRTAAADRMAAANAQSGVPAGRMAFADRVGTPLPGSGMKKGGRTGKADGGMMYDDISPRMGSVGSSEFKEAQEKSKGRSRYAAKGGKISNFEGSAKDEMQDKKLAKKRGMSMKAWEASEADKKHDKQQSMKGLKKGGRTAKADGGNLDPRNAGKDGGGPSGNDFMHAMMPLTMLMKKGGRAGKAGGGAMDGNYTGGTRPTGGRIAKAGGGLLSSLMGGSKASSSSSKGKKKGTNINIVINAGQKPTDPMAGLPMLPPGKPPMLPPAMSAGAPAPAGGPSMPPPDMGGPAPGGGGLGALLGRKAGGRVGNRSYSSYKDMDAGAGGGLGRLEKTEIAQKTYRK